MSFGFCNRLASFQHYINDILRKYLNNFCTVYCSDILIFNKDELKQKLHVKKILSKFQDAELQVDIIKLQIHVSNLAYLRLIITLCDVCMHSAKVDTIIN